MSEWPGYERTHHHPPVYQGGPHKGSAISCSHASHAAFISAYLSGNKLESAVVDVAHRAQQFEVAILFSRSSVQPTVISPVEILSRQGRRLATQEREEVHAVVTADIHASRSEASRQDVALLAAKWGVAPSIATPSSGREVV
eukprot:scaffold287355_cov33-Tisochrysis_lutea.AAC.1